MKKYLIPSVLMFTLAIMVLGFSQRPQKAEGSVGQGNEYKYAILGTAMNNNVSSTTIIDTLTGSLGQITLTGTTSGSIIIYDASTTDSTLRSPNNGSTATSSLNIIAQIVAGEPVGTYTFDVSFYRGLLVQITGTAPTSTISYRTF